MSLTVSIITNPDNLSPILNSPVWFRLNSASSSTTNFKYVVRLNKEAEPFTNIFDVLQTYKLPARPFGECEYTPSKYLESFFGYKPTPYILNWTASNDALLRYNINYGFEYTPNFNFIGTYNTGGFLGLSFSTLPDIQIGDTIRINKTNKQVNVGYDGLATVTATVSGGVTTNLSFGTTQSGEIGKIDSLLRLNATSSNYEAFYGTRQYDEINVDFSDTYIIGSTQGANFLSEYPMVYKPTLSSDYETLSMIMSATQGSRMFLELYNGVNILATYSYVIPTTNLHKRVDFGVGPQNIILNMASASFFNGVDNYSVFVRNDYSINVNYRVTGPSARFNFDLTYAGFYGGVPYYTWTSSVITFYIWYDTINTIWVISNALGGGNDYLNTNTNLDDVPPTGSLVNGIYLTGSNPLFVDFTLTNRYIDSELRRFKFISDCYAADENFRLVWLNRLGGWEYFNFTLGGKKSINIERETFKKVLPYNYSVGDRQDTTYAQKAEEMWSINSNWITEDESEWLSSLLESREVYHMKNSEIYPIQIMDKSYQVKTVLRDQLFNITIQFKYAFNKVI